VTTPRRNSRHPCANVSRALRQPIGYPIKGFVTRAKTSKAGQLAVIRRSTGIGSHTFESYYRAYKVAAYKVATSCVNRCTSRICHIRLCRMKLQENFLLVILTEFSSLSTHNIYLCAIIVFSSSVESHVEDLNKVLSLLWHAGVSPRLDKGCSFHRQVNYL
jgi:hypothetical protein